MLCAVDCITGHQLTRPARPRAVRPPRLARPVPLVFMDPEEGLLFGFV